jgi:hypothetical protein
METSFSSSVAALLSDPKTTSQRGTEKCLSVVGGNQGGSAVKNLVQEVKRMHPNLDVAQDKPLQHSSQ